MRVFLDTNVLFSAAYHSSGHPAALLDAAAFGRYIPVICRVVVDEVVRNLRKKAPQALGSLERTFQEVSFEMAPEPRGSEVKRWAGAGFGSDAPVLAAAIEAEVDYFCTGDKRLRARSETFGVLNVVSPAELLELLPEAPR